MSDALPPLPFAIAADQDDAEVVALIESWRHRGPTVGWDAVVGHEPQVRRCQEVVEALRRPDADLDRLRIRLGRGLVLAGLPGPARRSWRGPSRARSDVPSSRPRCPS